MSNRVEGNPITGVEVLRLEIPLVEPFVTAAGARTARTVVLVRVEVADGHDGWGECVATEEPTYTGEWALGAHRFLTRHLVPRFVKAAERDPDGEHFSLDALARILGVAGNPMACGSLVDALTDAALRNDGRSLAGALGSGTKVVAGVAVGMAPLDELAAAAAGRAGEGYRRIKVKVAPGHDLEALRVVRDAVGPDVALVADANGAYDPADGDHVRRLFAIDTWSDELGGPTAAGLSMLEQPFPGDAMTAHAELVPQLHTPVCLDEAIGSVGDAEVAVALGAADVVCLKAGRVGGVWAARAVHDVCVAAGVSLYGGGMLETGIGRAQALAVAALPGCTLASDLSASSRYWARDVVTEPVEVTDGVIAVPDGPGLGVTVDLAAVDAFCHQREWFPLT